MPENNKIKLSVFVPVCNEEKILFSNVTQIYNGLKKLKDKFEIVVVDDNSKDKTPLIAKKLIKNENIKYIRYKNGPSRRENLADSFKTAKGDIIIFMDVDLSTPTQFLPKLIGYVKDGADIAIGSRYLKGSRVKREAFRRLISYLYNSMVRLYFSSKIRDHQNGFKAFKKGIALKIIKKMGYDKSFKRGWFWDAEFLIRAQIDGYKIVEFPINWRYGKKSTFNIRNEIRMIPYILKLKKMLKNEV